MTQQDAILESWGIQLLCVQTKIIDPGSVLFLLRFKYLTNISWLFGERIFKIGISFFVGVWLARYLGPSEFGLYNYIISLVGIFTALTTLGLDHILIRELVKSKNWHSLLGTSFWLRMAGSIALFLLSVLFFPFFTNNTRVILLFYLLATIWLLQPFNVIDCAFQAKVLSRYPVRNRILASLTSSIVKVLFILFHADLYLFLVVLIFENIILALGYVLLAPRVSVVISKFRFQFNIAKSLMKDAWPLLISVFAVALFLKIDQVMIIYFLDTDALGKYAAAVRISEAVYFVPAILISTFYPAIIWAKQQNKTLYNNRLQKFYDVMIWTGIAISAIIFAFSKEIVQVLYGKSYFDSGPVLAIFSWTVVFVFMANASSRWFLAENRQILLMVLNVIASIFNIILNLILIPRFGIKGAAISSLISYSIASFWGLLLFRPARRNLEMLCRAFSPWGVLKRLGIVHMLFR
ncbi:oligosaccharide flippase family protein [candidate division KSB1 bacterium]|nr:oligosaccharide flippase family protein [candidate division KSB1 bacterium]